MDNDIARLIMVLTCMLLGMGYPQNIIRKYLQARRNREALALSAKEEREALALRAKEERERILAADVDEMGEQLYQARLLERQRLEGYLIALDMRRY